MDWLWARYGLAIDYPSTGYRLSIIWPLADYKLSISWLLAGYWLAISYLLTGHGLAICWAISRLSPFYGVYMDWLWTGYQLSIDWLLAIYRLVISWLLAGYGTKWIQLKTWSYTTMYQRCTWLSFDNINKYCISQTFKSFIAHTANVNITSLILWTFDHLALYITMFANIKYDACIHTSFHPGK